MPPSLHVTPAGAPARAYAAWALVLVLAGVTAAVALQPAAALEGEEGLSDPAVFAENSYANVCAECHGSVGQGGTVPGTDEEAPPLAGEPDVTTPYVDLVLATGRMPPAGDPFDNRAREVFYTDAERAAMVSWISDAFDLEGEIPEVGDGNIARGLEVYSLNCAHCHGSAGSGGTAGANAFTPEINDDTPTSIVEAIRVGPFEMPQFSTDIITPEEAQDVAAFLRSVDEASGTPVLRIVELNPVFASGFVGLLALALLGSLLYIGGRPIPFERVPDEELPSEVKRPVGKTPMPGDPAYDEPMELDREQRHEPLPYLDEDDGAPTSGQPERVAADEVDADEPPDEEPPRDDPS